MKKIYSLGGGCWPNMDIPKEYHLDSIFKSFWTTNKDIFMPLELFNGNLENEFLHKDNNWVIDDKTWDNEHIKIRKEKNPNYISNYLVLYRILNINNGWVIMHPSHWKNNPTNKYAFKPLFQNFNDNKYNLFYIIDFQRAGYEKYQNYQLLEFEKFLVENKYDLKNFVYLDVNTAKIKDRFNNCKIKSFVNDVNDKRGLSNINDLGSFRNTKCFFATQIEYINSIIETSN